MCTVTVWPGGRDLHLWFNRDEQRSRPVALPPQEHPAGDSFPWLAPLDPAGGGTWLAVNAAGLCLGLLNAYSPAFADPGPGGPSRGLIIPGLIGAPTPAAAALLLEARGLGGFRPFHLFAVDRSGRGWLATWDGMNLLRQPLPGLPWFFTTSSFRTEEVEKSRHDAFLQARARSLAGHPSPTAIEAWHRATGFPGSAETICMVRPDAHTVSISWIQMGPAGAEWRYAPTESSGDLPGPFGPARVLAWQQTG